MMPSKPNIEPQRKVTLLYLAFLPTEKTPLPKGPRGAGPKGRTCEVVAAKFHDGTYRSNTYYASRADLSGNPDPRCLKDVK